MIVVSDTSLLANLALVGQIDLLRQLYGQVFIPPAVQVEIAAAHTEQTDAIGKLSWIEGHAVANQLLVRSLQLELDQGEAEAIALASELKADILLIDERKGRAVAERLGLRFIGVLGVLVEAKHRQLIPSVRPILDNLVTKAGFWISQDLYTRVLQAVAE